MHRSSSTSTRASDEFLLGLGMGMGSTTPAMSNCTGGQGALLDYYSSHLLPKYDPQSQYSAKKEVARARSSSRAIHLIPLVLIACAVVLWFFSSPRVVGMTIKADSVVIAGIDNTTIQRLINNNGTQVKELEAVGALAAATAAAASESTSSSTLMLQAEIKSKS